MGTKDDWRSPEIVPDTILELLSRESIEYTGNTVYGEAVLREAGIDNFSRYNLIDGDLMPLSAQMGDPDYERPE